MPYTRITPTKNAREALFYALYGKAHNKTSKTRNLFVGSVGLLPSDVMSYEEQFEHLLERRSSRNKTAVRRMITSYSKDELDPNDPKSVEIAYQIELAMHEKYFPGFPAVICIQADGEGGCLHVHDLTANISVIDHKGFTPEMAHYTYLEHALDETAKEFIITPETEPIKDKVSQYERKLREKKEAGDDVYIWKDDLKERIKKAMSEARDHEDFLKKLTENGVEGTYRTSKKQGDFVLYELTDTTNFTGEIPANLKAKSYKLGSDYDVAALAEHLKENAKQNDQQAEFDEFMKNEPEPKPEPEFKKREKKTPENTFYMWIEDVKKLKTDAYMYENDEHRLVIDQKKFDVLWKEWGEYKKNPEKWKQEQEQKEQQEAQQRERERQEAEQKKRDQKKKQEQEQQQRQQQAQTHEKKEREQEQEQENKYQNKINAVREISKQTQQEPKEKLLKIRRSMLEQTVNENPEMMKKIDETLNKNDSPDF